MLKKISALLMCMTLVFGATMTVHARWVSSYYAINKLIEYEILDRDASEKWQNDDYITRRDAFKLSLKVCDPVAAFIQLDKERRSPEDMKENIDSFKEYYPDLVLDFSDVEYGSDDYQILGAAMLVSLIVGDSRDGIHKARFDDYLTHGEAVTLISRIPFMGISYQLNDEVLREAYNSEYPAFDYLEDIRVINSSIPGYYGCLEIQKDDFDKPIRAHDFFLLLYRIMYAPTCVHGEYYADTTGTKIDAIFDYLKYKKYL